LKKLKKLNMSFPNEREQKLGAALVKYCSDLANSDRLDEGAQESMNIAMECLQQAFDFSDVPKSDVNLLDLVCGPSEEKEEVGDGAGVQCTEYCDFIWQIESKGYFKGCELGDEQHMTRLQNAFKKYKARFPDADVAPCDLSWEERKAQAQSAKNEGNTALKNKEYDSALEKYTAAIRLNPGEATFFSNRSAAYMHLNNAEKAKKDANRAIQRKPEWAKGYMRLGAANKLSGDTEGATKAYRTALSKCSPDDPLWTQINEHIEACEKTTRGPPGGANPLANMFGGMPPMGGGQGGMPDFGSMMNNPMMQQMAQKFMSDPNMMEKVQNMMQDPAMMDMARNMMGGMPPGMGGPGGPGAGAPPSGEDSAKFMQLMQDPAKMQEVLQKVSTDPELEAMKTNDPEAARILEGLATGDMSMGMQLMQKPDVMVKLRTLVAKHC